MESTVSQPRNVYIRNSNRAFTCTAVFGQVIQGMEVVKKVEACGTKSGKPTKRIEISNCGIYE